jgi:hypothetical protein
MAGSKKKVLLETLLLAVVSHTVFEKWFISLHRKTPSGDSPAYPSMHHTPVIFFLMESPFC